MGKRRFLGGLALFVVAVVFGSWGGGCGTARGPGTSFRALGFFAAGDGSVTDSGASVSLTDDLQVPADVDCDNRITEADGGLLGLQNSLIQGISVDHVDIDYRVVGSTLPIPGFVFPLAERLGPSSEQEPLSPPTRFRRITIVPASTLDFLDRRRGELPRVPFDLIAEVTAVGIDDSGDRLRTNRIGYPMTVFDGPRACISPTETPTEAPDEGTSASPTPTP